MGPTASTLCVTTPLAAEWLDIAPTHNKWHAERGNEVRFEVRDAAKQVHSCTRCWVATDFTPGVVRLNRKVTGKITLF